MSKTKSKSGKAKSRYKPHPMLVREAAFSEKLAAESGKSLAAWIDLSRAKGPKKASLCRKWLVAEHGVTPHQAMWIASYAVTNGDPDAYGDPEALVTALYGGANKSLLPIHDAVVDMANALGEDVTTTSCKTMVPIYRKHVFAELRPVGGAVLVQLALGDRAPKGRLQKSEGRMPDDRLTHSVLLRSASEVNAEFKGFLVDAYGAGATKRKRAASAVTPADLAAALKKSAAASKTWATCTPAMQRDFILWVTSAKQAETRTRRLERVIATLVAGKRKAY